MNNPECHNCGHKLNLWYGKPSHLVRYVKAGKDMGCGYPDAKGRFCKCKHPEPSPVESAGVSL